MDGKEEISEKERQTLLNKLHKSLFWVGEQIPQKIRINEKQVHLHEIIWEIVNKPKLDKEDQKDIEEFIYLLTKKETEYEELIEKEKNFSSDEANELFERAAGIKRSIMDLKELTSPSKRKKLCKERHICKDVGTSEWDAFTKELKK